MASLATIEKAKLYKTAIVEHDTEVFKAGQCVAVNFVGVSSGSLRFLCDLGENSEVLYEHDLKDFVL